jgi:hypothetical protein
MGPTPIINDFLIRKFLEKSKNKSIENRKLQCGVYKKMAYSVE